MDNNQLTGIMEDLKNAVLSLNYSITQLNKSIESNTAIQQDIFNVMPIDMMQNLNGSLQELVKELENKNFRN